MNPVGLAWERRILVVVACAVLTGTLAVPADGECSESCAGSDADPEALSTSWETLYAHYQRYGNKCEDGAAGEASSEAVLMLLDGWERLPRLKELIERDPKFGNWVIWHLDDMHGDEEPRRIRQKATDACPPGCGSLCARIAERAKTVAEEVRRAMDRRGVER